jgi:hypothetical protein
LTQRTFHVVQNSEGVEDLFDLEDSAAIQLPQIRHVRHGVPIGSPRGQDFSLLLKGQRRVTDNLSGMVKG